MATYTITAMQKRAFTGRFAIYRPDVSGIRTGTLATINKVVYQPHSVHVHGRVTSTPDYANPTPTGRVNAAYLDTTDRIRFNIHQQVEDSWFVLDEDSGQWYTVVGGAKKATFRAAEQWLYIKRTVEPDLDLVGITPVDESQ